MHKSNEQITNDPNQSSFIDDRHAASAGSGTFRAARCRIFRFHHMMAPVTNMSAGTTPVTAHTAFNHGPQPGSRQRPKCSRESHISATSPGRSPYTPSGSENRSTRLVSGSGIPRYQPETPHISMNRNNQKPSALCRSQFNRRQPDFHLKVRLRFQRVTPGHHTTSPVSTSSENTRLKNPFHHGPSGLSISNSSWRRTIQRTKN